MKTLSLTRAVRGTHGSTGNNVSGAFQDNDRLGSQQLTSAGGRLSTRGSTSGWLVERMAAANYK